MSWAFKGPSKPYSFKPWGGGSPPAYPLEPSSRLKDYRARLSDWAMRTVEYTLTAAGWILYRKGMADFYGISPRGKKWLIEVKSTFKGELENPTLTFASYDSSNVIEALDKNPGLNYALIVYFRQPMNGEFKACLNCDDVLKAVLPKVEKRNFSLRWRVFKDLHRVEPLNTFAYYF
jgi:hypothetical protein